MEGKFEPGSKPKAENPADEWLLTKLQQITERVSDDLDNYRFSEAYDNLYHFVWDDFADWYIEASKIHLNKSVLAYGLEVILKLTHPFAPFVTETIWQTLNGEGDSLLITSQWPEAHGGSSKDVAVFDDIMTLVNEIRFITASTGVAKPKLYHQDDDFIAKHAELIQKLAGLSGIQAVADGAGLNLTQTTHKAWLDLDHDTINHFVKQLADKLADTKKSIEQLEGRLNNKAYVDKAPKSLVHETKQQLEDAKELLAKQQAEHDRFKR